MNATITATQTTFRVIFTCRNKNCKHVFAFDYRTEGTDRYGLAYGSRELKAGEAQEKYDPTGRRTHNADVMGALRCPECKVNLPKSTRVEGKYSAAHVCSAKCMGAKSGACECECGGANHGVNHL